MGCIGIFINLRFARYLHIPLPPQKKASLVRTVTIHPKRNWVLPQLIVNQPLPRLQKQGLSGTCMFNPMFEPDCPILRFVIPKRLSENVSFAGSFAPLRSETKSLEIKSQTILVWRVKTRFFHGKKKQSCFFYRSIPFFGIVKPQLNRHKITIKYTKL